MRQLRFGGGFVFCHVTALRMRKPRPERASATEKTLWNVPQTQIVPASERHSRQALSHWRVNAPSACAPRDLSHAPLSTQTRRPDWTEKPPFERK